jgi:pyrroloquinoline-quinone synthase
MEIVKQLDLARAECNVLEHPFYLRWSAGELNAGELRLYAGQYRHAVVALADASAGAARCAPLELAAGLQRHAEEEREHVALWDAFARAAGSDSPAEEEPLAATCDCAAAWTAGGSLLDRLAVLYAVEAGQPEVSQTKLDGLEAHYGFSTVGPATEYFRLHGWLDVEHARSAAQLIEQLCASAGADEQEHAVQRAREALAGNWELLSAVEEAA